MREDLVFNHYSKILDNLLTDSTFAFVFQEPREFSADFDSFFYKKMPDNLFLCFGASRFCLIDDNYPFVVKVDYSNPIEYFPDFPSFCEKERYICSKAQERNFDKYLTEVKFLGTYRKVIKTYELADIDRYYSSYDLVDFDYASYVEALEEMERDGIEQREVEIVLPLYGYEKVDIITLNPKLNSREREYYRSFNSPLSEVAVGVIVRFIEDYGLEEYYDFNEFLQEFNIHDIHAGNVGEIYGKIVILDYASYPKHGYSDDTEFD